MTNDPGSYGLVTSTYPVDEMLNDMLLQLCYMPAYPSTTCSRGAASRPCSAPA